MTAPSPQNSPNLRLVSRDALAKPPFDDELGTEFGWFDRVNYGWSEDSKALIDYTDWEARDLHQMLRHSARGRLLETVLTQPLIASEHSIEPIKGDTGEAEFLTTMFDGDELSGNCETSLQDLIDQATSAIVFKKAFWEMVWDVGQGDLEDKVIYKRVSWRPQTTCRPMREPVNGRMVGFEQESYYRGPDITKGIYPFQILNKPGKAPRAFIYINGKRRDPINGISELEIAFWAHKLKQRVILLWLQYLENYSMARTVVKGSNEDEVKKQAGALNATRGGGTVALYSEGGPQNIAVDTITTATGPGAEQFLACIKWLDSEPANSVLAGFVDMAANAAQGGGGAYALSQDSSDFYLQTEEARLDEIGRGIRAGAFAPVLRYNFGPNAKIPRIKFEPLTAEDKQRTFDLLKAVMMGRDPQTIPGEFIAALATRVANFVGLDEAKTQSAFEQANKEAQDRQALQDKMAQAQFDTQQTQAHAQVKQTLAGVDAVTAKAKTMLQTATAPIQPAQA